jgi:hypothetical protein
VKYKCKEREKVTLPLPKVYLQQLHVQLYVSFFLIPNENSNQNQERIPLEHARERVEIMNEG